MGKIVGIQFSTYGKVYLFDSGHFVLQKGDSVMVNTEQGQAIGIVCTEPKNPGDDPPKRPLKKVFRMATVKDLNRFEKKCELEKEVIKFCGERIKARSLPMRLISSERLFDGSKIIVYFCADGRVDFRDLVKDLVQRFHTRIEMKQVPVRSQAKMVGGLGSCGRQLCCSSFLTGFEPVTIKMAKQQNLSLNPAKISGMCGRLMCCLTYENAYYEKAQRNIPKIGKRMKTEKGDGKVIRQNVLKQTLTVLLQSGEEMEMTYDEVNKKKR